LLVFFLYHVMGYHAWFAVSSYLHKREMTRTIKSNMPLEQLRFSPSEIQELVFLDGGKEVAFRGKMYDVRDSCYEGGMLLISCIEDSKEKEMLREMNAFMDGTEEGNSPVKKHKNNFKDLVNYFEPVCGLAFFPDQAVLENRTAAASLSSALNELFIPPPEARHS
jgi:hypothetical protein